MIVLGISLLKQLHVITLGYCLAHDEYKEELTMFFKILGKKIKENKDIIKEAKYYANIT